MEVVQDRTTATLLPIIQAHVAKTKGYQMFSTQNVESYWARVKLKFKCMKEVDGQQLP